MIAVVSLFVLALTMNVAFARERSDRNHHGHGDDPSVNIDVNNHANIDNNIDADANTGDNRGGAQITTGGAYADALSDTRANRNDVWATIPEDGKVVIDVDNDAHIDNDIDADADTGDNSVHSSRIGRFFHSFRTLGTITTGDATAYATAMTIVNDSVVTVE